MVGRLAKIALAHVARGCMSMFDDTILPQFARGRPCLPPLVVRRERVCASGLDGLEPATALGPWATGSWWGSRAACCATTPCSMLHGYPSSRSRLRRTRVAPTRIASLVERRERRSPATWYAEWGADRDAGDALPHRRHERVGGSLPSDRRLPAGSGGRAERRHMVDTNRERWRSARPRRFSSALRSSFRLVSPGLKKRAMPSKPAQPADRATPRQTGRGQRDLHEGGADYIARLRGLGVRVTPQRLLVLEGLEALGGHITADALLQWAAQRYPALNLATVYRTLDLLLSIGLIAQTDLGSGVTSFELVGESPHHHLVCERCGAVGELDAALLAPLQQRLMERYGFRANPRHVALFGLCRECLRAAESQRDHSPPNGQASANIADAGT